MSKSESLAPDRIDELIKETKAARRTATWQLLAIVVSAVPGILTAFAQAVSTAVILAFVLPIVLVATALYAYSGSGSGGGSWYGWVEARERLRLLDIYSMQEFGISAYHDLYVSSLRMHYQFALAEGRKEMAEYLMGELQNESGSSKRAKENS